MIPDSNFPYDTISDKYVNTDKKNWYLLQFTFKRCPLWINKWSKINLFFFREIAYLNKVNEIEGFGRAWIPISKDGLKIIYHTMVTFNPKPIGLVLRKLYGEDISFEVEENGNIIEMTHSPYFLSKISVKSYKRIIKRNSTQVVLVYTEEEFINNK